MKQVIRFRQDLHKIPEASLYEYKTKEYILNKIKNLNCEIKEIGETSLVAYFNKNKKNTIALRCDMDALPIKEINEIDYKSVIDGYSHACGHDGHMAMILECAYFLNENNDVENNVLLIFQAAEENMRGADIIVSSNVLKHYNVKHVFGMHIWPNLNNNEIYTKENELCAMTSELDIEVVGKSVHVANSEEGIDTIYISTCLLNDLYSFEKSLDSSILRLLKFGKITSGVIRNVISDNTLIQGTLRTYNQKDFDKILNKIKSIANNYEEKYKCKININNTTPCKAVINNEQLALRFFNEEKVSRLNKPYLQGEDFGSYCQAYDSCFFMLGCGFNTQLHTNTFNFDEEILITGSDFFKKITKMEF